MSLYTKIIYSATRDEFYIGESANLVDRCEKQNRLHNGWTSGMGPRVIKLVEVFASMTEAKAREKFL